MIVTIDFETVDRYIRDGYGAGWCFPKGEDFRVLGASIKIGNQDPEYFTDMAAVKSIVEDADTLIMHNATYDLGCLHHLGIKYKGKTIFDTYVMAKLYNSALESYSLDSLAAKYLRDIKDTEGLAKVVHKLDLLPWTKKDLTTLEKDPEFRREFDYKSCHKFAIENMDLLQEQALESVAKYANQDVNLTRRLYDFFLKNLDERLAAKYSKVSEICVAYRAKGVRIDVNQARLISSVLSHELSVAESKFTRLYGDVNPNSNKQLAELFDKHNITYELTVKGNPQITSSWLESQDNDISKLIIEIRELKKIKGDFIDKILEMQERGNGRVYPELNLLHARTGRFSSSNPNIQQIPGRDPRYSEMCRSVFIPEEGEKWFSLDYSNQEGRLQIHYAHQLDCTGANEFILEFRKDPNFDIHAKIARLMGVDRPQAKTINLGLSYGMGNDKLAAQLQVSGNQAAYLKDRYFRTAPYLKELDEVCKKSLKTNGYIRTIGGRHLKIDPPIRERGRTRTFEYRALNKLIQGSAADQMIEAMIEGYKAGIPVLFPVHDQVCISGTEEDAKKMKEIMEKCISLSVPSVVDMNPQGGENWARAGH